ncbi:MAG: hypothetical protein AVDCRST_MAG41-2521, partial [uncultured Corynebacteriales bacterium]
DPARLDRACREPAAPGRAGGGPPPVPPRPGGGWPAAPPGRPGRDRHPGGGAAVPPRFRRRRGGPRCAHPAPAAGSRPGGARRQRGHARRGHRPARRALARHRVARHRPAVARGVRRAGRRRAGRLPGHALPRAPGVAAGRPGPAADVAGAAVGGVRAGSPDAAGAPDHAGGPRRGDLGEQHGPGDPAAPGAGVPGRRVRPPGPLPGRPDQRDPRAGGGRPGGHAQRGAGPHPGPGGGAAGRGPGPVRGGGPVAAGRDGRAAGGRLRPGRARPLPRPRRGGPLVLVLDVGAPRRGLARPPGRRGSRVAGAAGPGLGWCAGLLRGGPDRRHHRRRRAAGLVAAHREQADRRVRAPVRPLPGRPQHEARAPDAGRARGARPADRRLPRAGRGGGPGRPVPGVEDGGDGRAHARV